MDQAGGTNTSSLKALIDLILSIPGFEGEIIIAENYHRLDSDTAYPNLWTTTDFRFNGPWNINSLIQYYRDNRDQYPAIHDHGSEINISKYMLRDRNQGGRVTTGPSDGDGYVRRTDLVYTAPPGGRNSVRILAMTQQSCHIRYLLLRIQVSLLTLKMDVGKMVSTLIRIINLSCYQV